MAITGGKNGDTQDQLFNCGFDCHTMEHILINALCVLFGGEWLVSIMVLMNQDVSCELAL